MVELVIQVFDQHRLNLVAAPRSAPEVGERDGAGIEVFMGDQEIVRLVGWVHPGGGPDPVQC